MNKKNSRLMDGVAETLMIPLYTRAAESRRTNGMIKDEKAVEIVQKLGFDYTRFQLHGHDEVAVILRMRHFDDKVRDFLARNPRATMVHIGCGLDTRFERVDNGQVQWFDLDLPEVIELRKKLIGGNHGRYHLIAGSVLDDTWLEIVRKVGNRPTLFIAEGVFPYFEEIQLRTLFLKLRDLFPGAEMVCDAHTPFVIRMDNLQLALTKVDARLRWGLKHGRDVEQWGEGISMLEEWFYFDGNEPRMARYNWMGRIPLLGKSTGIFHYRLGVRPVGNKIR
ncbi:MAG: class I SAM-dependent methyltransferase [Anaerolineaceae bacterium]